MQSNSFEAGHGSQMLCAVQDQIQGLAGELHEWVIAERIVRVANSGSVASKF